MYNFIGIFILCFGLCLVPFLPNLINSGSTYIDDLVPIYILMLMSTASGYFFSYKRSLLEADQKNYYNSINTIIVPFEEFSTPAALSPSEPSVVSTAPSAVKA